MSRGFRQEGLVIQPAGLASFERDKGGHIGQLRANALDRLKVIGVHADNPGAAVVDQIGKIIRDQAVIERDEDGADLRHGVERFQLGMSVGRDVSDAVALLHTKRLQSRRPTIATVEKFLVVQPPIAIHDGIAFGIELARAPREFERT